MYYNNTNANSFSASTMDYTSGTITLSASGMTDAANGDFRTNNVASAGALLRAAGYNTLPTADGYTKTSVGYLDVGALQSGPAGTGISRPMGGV